MTTRTRDTGQGLVRRLAGERATPSDEVAGVAPALASVSGVAEADPPALAFFDGLADERELAVWGAWRRGRGEM